MMPKKETARVILPPETPTQRESRAAELIREKHREYTAMAQMHKALYYALRLVAGLSAALLPFVVAANHAVATMLSVFIVVATVIDMIFNPKDRWQLLSRAASLLTMERFKRTGENKDYESMLSILVATESSRLDHLVSIDELLSNVKKVRMMATNSPRS